MTYDDAPIGEFLDDVASERVAPAGGTAAAITGATGAALCEMVCVHTMAAGRDRPAGPPGAVDGDVAGNESGTEHAKLDGDSEEPSFPRMRSALRRRRKTLLALADRDGAVVEELFGADGAPSTRVERRATGIPLAVAEAALEVLMAAEAAFRHGRAGVAADARTGAYLADAAVRASVTTVRINAAALPEGSFATDVEERATDVAAAAAAVRGRLLDAEA